MAEISRRVDEHVRRTGRGRAALTSLVLRSLKQAHYDARNRGHFGLRSPHYCHFTSPIRRYPDLICHRALLAAIGAGEDAAARPRAMEEAAEWCSLRERDAAAIERAADDVARCFLLESELFERGWEHGVAGEVIGVIGAGAFVAFGDEHEGLLPVRRLRGDWWELDPLEVMLIGAESGKAIRLGDPVHGAGRARRRAARAGRSLARRVVASAEPHGRHRDQQAGVLPLPPAREVGGGPRAHRHRGQVAARRQGAAQGRLRARARRRGLAAQRAHPALRARPRARTTSPSARARC